MTTLNFSKYVKNLSKYGFSDSLIIKEKLTYQHCNEELEKITYNQFQTKFLDLDNFERIQCDFSNYYRWTGGQEPIDGIRILNVKFKNPFNAMILIEYFDYNQDEKKNMYWGSNLVTLRKIKANWKIESIAWR